MPATLDTTATTWNMIPATMINACHAECHACQTGYYACHVEHDPCHTAYTPATHHTTPAKHHTTPATQDITPATQNNINFHKIPRLPYRVPRPPGPDGNRNRNSYSLDLKEEKTLFFSILKEFEFRLRFPFGPVGVALGMAGVVFCEKGCYFARQAWYLAWQAWYGAWQA